MGMSDCIKCWDTPCRCGHDYLDWSEEDLDKQITMLQGVLNQKVAARPEPTEFTDVKFHPHADVRFHFQRMIWENEKSAMIGFVTAELTDSGKLSWIREGDEYYYITLTSGKSYRVPKASYTSLNVEKWDQLAVFKFGAVQYLQRPREAAIRPEKTKTLSDFITKRSN